MKKALKLIRDTGKDSLRVIARKVPRVYEALVYDDGEFVSRSRLISQLSTEIKKITIRGEDGKPVNLSQFLIERGSPLILDDVIENLSLWIELTGRE